MPDHSTPTRLVVRTSFTPTMAWSRDLPDFRDESPATAGDALAALKRRAPRAPRPESVDLREYLSPVSEVASHYASSADAVLALVQYFERRATGRLVAGSVPFLDYTARRLAGFASSHTTNNAPLGLRSALKALVRFGCPPAHAWPSEGRSAAQHNGEPDAFCYAFQRDFAEIRYLRLDTPGTAGAEVLRRVKSFVAAGFALVGGASLPESITSAADVPYPTHHDAVAASSAFTVVGYDDAYRIRSQKGALVIRSTFGPDWGDAGYGYLPYRYVEEFAACDFWTLVKPEWMKSREFEQPR